MTPRPGKAPAGGLRGAPVPGGPRRDGAATGRRWALVAPLAVEAAALRGAAAGADLLRPRTVRRADGACAAVVAGVAGGLDPTLVPGDVVVASEVRHGPGTQRLPAAPLLVAALRRSGVPARLGPVVSAAGLVRGDARRQLAATGALAVDTESADLLAQLSSLPEGPAALAVVRVVVDTAERELLRPATISGGVRALHRLRTTGPALAAWAAAARPRRVVVASPRAFCAGVERAVDIVARALDRYGAPVYVRRQIVHNGHVVADLTARGAVFVDELDDVPAGSVVVFSAHGVSPGVRADAAARGLHVVDATCPLVEKVHREAQRYVAQGATVLLLGHDGHEEVEGTLGEAPGAIHLIGGPDDVDRLDVPDPARVALLTQTTLAADEARVVAEQIRLRFPALRTPPAQDVCYASQNRQDAVRAVAGRCGLVLVIGAANSSNSQRLVEVAQRAGSPARLVADAGDIDPAWLVDVDAVGITAGASAPESLVQEVVDALGGLGPVDVAEERVAVESVRFHLPMEVT